MSLHEDVTALAVLKALRDTVDAEYRAAHRRVLDRLCTAPGHGPTRVTLPDGTLAATVTMVYPAPAAVVVDDEAQCDLTGVRVRVRARASWQRDLPDSSEEIGRAWQRGEIDLRELLRVPGGGP
ncbi:hypothetical protein Drose_31930 [Dactylosporangium roseum]|uniref:Bacterial SCP orthologue domain-containing protein n=1 Tax=Dactylosporangium roseum TaxID=47989 RepID=A0ABY5Z243_9ACTN|nr:hypothetical protein [Dactylosporangium roseum]UWZ35671.1 hypothetical protein Drose_31930 [Dactylosporangium roseum]